MGSRRKNFDGNQREALPVEVAGIFDDPPLDTAMHNQSAERLPASAGPGARQDCKASSATLRSRAGMQSGSLPAAM